MEVKYFLKRYKNKLVWIALGLFALLLKLVASAKPELVESYYSRGLFLGIRWTIDTFLAWLPIPLIYLFFIILAIYLFRNIRKWWRNQDTWPIKLLHAGIGILSFTSGALFFFLFLWGYNYDRIALEDHLNIKPKPLSIEELREELEFETELITRLRASIPGITDSAINDSFLPPDLEKKLRNGLEKWLADHDYPTVGRVRGRILYPKGIFLRFSSSGLYFPFTGEGHVDAGLNGLQRVYVMAHELGHGYGFGDEGSCNFLAYVNCVQSEDPLIAYLGHLAYWRTVAVNYLRYEREKYQAFREELPPGIIADLNAINENLQKYPDIMPKLRYYAYDSYLKAQGIKEGMANYNRVIMLVKSYRKKEG